MGSYQRVAIKKEPKTFLVLLDFGAMAASTRSITIRIYEVIQTTYASSRSVV